MDTSHLPSRAEAARQRAAAAEAQAATRARSARTPEPTPAPQRSTTPAAASTPRSTSASTQRQAGASSSSTTTPQRRSVLQRGAQETKPAYDWPQASSGKRSPKRSATAPADKKKPLSKGRRWARRIGKGIAFSMLFLVLAGLGVFGYLYNRLTIPAADEVALAQTTTVYYNDGTTRMGTFSEVNRTIIDASTLPDYVPHAIVASEDRTFYTNSGIDIRGILRALYTNITTGSRQGGSTLTQQYVERYYMGDTTSYVGKAKEAILALKINNQQTKDEIIGNYMNTIYFGRGAYGIEAAAKAYYGKAAKDLTLSESAMLAGIIPAPSVWDPAVDPEQAQSRWERVLNLMVEDGWINKAEADAATFPQTVDPNAERTDEWAGPQGYLLEQVRAELKATGAFTDEQIENGGLTIISTIDKAKNDAAIAAANTMNEVEGWNPETMHLALSSVDPNTGEIVAEYAGHDYLVRQQNAVTQDISAAASTFKTFTLLANQINGGSIEDLYDGRSPRRFDGLAETVENDGGYSWGRVNLTKAMQYSINTAFVELNEKIGSDKTLKVAIDAGIPEDTLGLDGTLLNVLGFAAPHNIDITGAYATIASGGYRITPHIVREVKNGDGQVVYKTIIDPKQVFNATELSGIMPALEAVMQRGGTGETVASLGRKVAGKTGTSEEQKSAQFVGMIPQLVTTVSMYQSDENGNPVPLTNIGGLDQFHGGDWPADVWLAYMKKATEGMDNIDYPWRVSVQQRPRLNEPVQPAVEETPQSMPEEQEEEPTQERGDNTSDEQNTPSPQDPNDTSDPNTPGNGGGSTPGNGDNDGGQNPPGNGGGQDGGASPGSPPANG